VTDKYWLFHKTHNPGVSAEDEDEESTEEGINAPTSTFTNAIDLMVEAARLKLTLSSRMNHQVATGAFRVRGFRAQGLEFSVYSLGIIPKVLAAASLDDLMLVSTRIDSANRRRPAIQRTRTLKHACSHAHTHYVHSIVFLHDGFV
jgi:hypothetical protein